MTVSEDIRERPEVLRRIPMFLALSDEQVLKILQHPENTIQVYGPREVICQQGEVGRCMYVVLEGTIEIVVHGIEGRDVTVATLKDGDYFGEQALLPGKDHRRNATARALHGATVLSIRKEDVLYALSHDPEFIEKFSSQSEEQQIENLLKSMRLFQALEEHDYHQIDQWAQVIELPPGEIVIRENEVGDYLYVVLQGSVEVFIVDHDGKVIILHELKEGNYFGEQALLPDGTGKRNANVRTNRAARLIKVPKEKFRLILERDAKLGRALRLIGEAQREKIRHYLAA